MGQVFTRRRRLVDPSFQLRLVCILTLQLLLWTLIIFHAYFVFFAIQNLSPLSTHKTIPTLYLEFLSHQGLILLSVALMAPIIVHELFKFSHRVAGPLYRCRQIMRDMAAGKPVNEFKARKHDLLADFLQDFNSLIREWNARRQSSLDGVASKPEATDPVRDMHFAESCEGL